MIASGLPVSPGMSIEDLDDTVFAFVVVSVNSCARQLDAINKRRISEPNVVLDSAPIILFLERGQARRLRIKRLIKMELEI